LVRLVIAPAAIAIVLGALVGLFVRPGHSLFVASLLTTTVVAWIAWGLRLERVAYAAICLAFLSAATALSADAARRALLVDLEPLGEPVHVRVQLSEDAAPQADFVALRGVVVAWERHGQWRPASLGVALTLGGTIAQQRAGEWRAGRQIEAYASFRRPSRYFNEGVPDFERDAALSGTALFGSIKSGWLVEVRQRGTAAEEASAILRAHVRRSIDRWVGVHDSLAAAIVTAVLIGDRTGLPDDVRLRLQAAGTYHVIAISGGNIAILAGLVLGIAALCGAAGQRGALVTLLILVAYAAIVSAGPSVWRATLMAGLYLLSRAIDHRTPVWHALTMAAAIVLCVRPLDIRDVGFILTFGATAALLEASRRLVVGAGPAAWVAGTLAASMAVEIALAPISATVFSRVTSAGLLLNLAAVPLMGVVQVGGILVSCFPVLETIARPAGWVAYAASTALVESARLVEVVPWLTSRVPPPSPGVVIVYYAAVATAVFFSGLPRRFAVGVAILMMLAIVTGQPEGWFTDARRSGWLQLTMIDVGQGDATLLEMPEGSRMLIDTGGVPFGRSGFDVGARVLSPALWARGVRALDALVITHGDPDHIGGAATIVQDFTPSAFWEGIPVPGHRPLADLHRIARATGAHLETRLAGNVIRFGPVHMRVLHPQAADWERPRVRNDDSIVLEIVYRDVAILLLGDVGAEVERSIASQLTFARHRILKVGHHGSRTSTSRELLERWRPQVALISCGRENPFGHPAPEVLRRLGSIGARIYRTDLDGQVNIDTDGEVVKVRTFRGEAR
jgi:competence protein ComEC